jgi:hypothetical protein
MAKVTFPTTDNIPLLVDKAIFDRMEQAANGLVEGVAHKRAGDYKAAMASYGESIKQAPENLHGYQNMAKVLAGVDMDEWALGYWLAYAHAMFSFYSSSEPEMTAISKAVLEYFTAPMARDSTGPISSGPFLFGNVWDAKAFAKLHKNSERVRLISAQINALDHVGRSFAMARGMLDDHLAVEIHDIQKWRGSLLGQRMGPAISHVQPGIYHRIGLLAILSSVNVKGSTPVGSPSQYYDTPYMCAIRPWDAICERWS